MTEDLSTFRLERLGAHSEGAPIIFLKHGANTVGRTPANSIVCLSKYVSRKHCEIFVTETGRVTVKNDITVNGVYINGIQQLDRNTEICLSVNDVLGIGCDTTVEEIQDSECFIFKIKCKESEVIYLDDSDEEDRIQEEYSQMNLSAMKQEMMDLQDFVEEYSRINEPDDYNDGVEFLIDGQENEGKDNAGDVPEEKINLEKIDAGDNLEQIINDERIDTGDPRRENIAKLGNLPDEIVNHDKVDTSYVLEKIISSSSSYAEKNDLIKKLMPDVTAFLAKDSSLIKNCVFPSTSTETINNSNSAAMKNPQRIKQLSFTIPLTDVNAMTNVNPENNTSHAPPPPPNNKTLVQDVPAKITQRRSTCYVAPSFANSGKRQIPIIDAPHMQKRRKSMSVMPESLKRQPKVLDSDSKWLSKNVKYQQKKRTKKEKDEIKSKLAALVPEPKPIIETKINRPNTKIPIKNTIRTRSDFLTDTIVKTISSPAPKVKIIESALPETAKRSRTVRNKSSSKGVSNEDPMKNSFHSSRTYRIAKRDEKKCTESKVQEASNRVPISNSSHSSTSYRIVKKNEMKVTVGNVEEALAYIHNGNNRSSNITRPDLNENNSKTTILPSTPSVVKSILKKSNSIRKRRTTVTFIDESPPKIARIATTPVIRTDEESCDDVIYNIMSLGMAALKESSNASPINGKNFAYKTVAHQYETLKSLQSVFVPLMKAELWKEIEDGYIRSKNTPATEAQMNYSVRDENHPERYQYHCESDWYIAFDNFRGKESLIQTRIVRAKSSAAVQNGALIIVSNVNSGKEFLGYIINKQMTNKICYFQLITPQESDAYTCTPLKIKQIMYIRPNLKVFEALFKLKNSPLVNHILNPKYNCFQPNNQPFEYNGFNSLNQDQMTTLQTVYQRMISGQPFISLVEGPPGTGKSRLITNLVVQLLYGTEIKQPLKILVCAPSNAAIDILTKNLSEARKKLVKERQGSSKKMKLVRFGVLEKMDRSVRGVSLQELTKDNNEKNALREQKRLMEYKKKKEKDLAHYTSNNMKEKIAAVRKEIEVIDAKMRNVIYDEKCLLEGANIICTTLNSCCALSNKISSMDVCIIDEATQCNEPTCLIPLQFGVKSLILVGDTKQLPSTVVSEIAKQYNYDQSLFQRLQKSFESEKENPILQLTTQYRMHPDILHWPNEYFYKNRLVSAETTKHSTIKLKPYTVFNLNFEQSSYSGQKHIANVDEANFVRNLLDFLITKANPKLYSYGIISAYSQQKDDLAKDLSLTYPYVSVNTIDSCQGQERDIVIISIARTRGIGFLAIRQRLNVALTRARKMLILCGNFNSLQSHSMWTNLLDDAKKRKLYIHLPKMDDSLLPSYFEKCLAT